GIDFERLLGSEADAQPDFGEASRQPPSQKGRHTADQQLVGPDAERVGFLERGVSLDFSSFFGWKNRQRGADLQVPRLEAGRRASRGVNRKAPGKNRAVSPAARNRYREKNRGVKGDLDAKSRGVKIGLPL